MHLSLHPDNQNLSASHFIRFLFFLFLVFTSSSCGEGEKPSSEIGSIDDLEKAVAQAGNRVLLFDLYADWCLPCRILSPVLDEIASEMGPEKVQLFKINVDNHPDIANAFGAAGIPYVVFILKDTVIQAFSGVRPKEDYIQVIKSALKRPTPVKPATEEKKPEPGFVRHISSHEASTLITNSQPFILDVRTSGEYASGHLKDAVLIPVQELGARMGELSHLKSQPVFVYCRSGNRSASAASLLEKQGFLKIYNLKSGLNEWSRSGGQVIR